MLALFCAAVPASGDATEREVRRLELAAHLSMRNGRSIPPAVNRDLGDPASGTAASTNCPVRFTESGHAGKGGCPLSEVSTLCTARPICAQIEWTEDPPPGGHLRQSPNP
jgi:hypothetical protein